MPGGGTRFVRVSRDGLVGDEVLISLDWQAELAAYAGEFDKADIAELWFTHAKIAKAEGEASVRIELLGSIPGPRPAGQPKVCSKRLLPF
jgi:hypothetical protein